MRKSRLLGWGIATLVIGSGPLLAILVAARTGLLAAISLWPGMVMVVIGWLRR